MLRFLYYLYLPCKDFPLFINTKFNPKLRSSTSDYFKKTELVIKSTEYWLIIVGMLQQNWALIDTTDNKTTIWFINDNSDIIDKLEFEDEESAENGLIENGFRKYLDPNERVLKFIHPPLGPFYQSEFNLKKFYSSGKFWH